MARFALGIIFTLIVAYIFNAFYKMGREYEKKEVTKGGEKSE